ncbi:Inorganic phosphate transporter pho84, partial [Friedmanniomyces endolithicus]
FFIDIAFWGLGLNNSAILSAIGFSSAKIVYHSLQNTAVGNLILGLAGNIPDYLVSAATIDTLDRWPTQFGSSAILTVLFCIIKFAYHILASSSLLALYVLCQFFSNFGANSTTFVEMFPTSFRSTAHGLSAGAGKLGAVIAQGLIFAAFVVCGLGTTLLIPETKRESLEYIAQKYHNEGGTEGAISEDERRAEEGEV